MFRKRRKPDPDENVELELRKLELNDRLADIHDIKMLIVGGFVLSAYFLVIQEVARYCLMTPLSWTATCNSVPFEVEIRSIFLLLMMILVAAFAAYFYEGQRSRAVEEYRRLLKRQRALRS
jgi:uncharacterized membrane protein